MRSISSFALILVLFALSACVTSAPPQTNVLPEGLSLRQPDQTLDLLRWSVENKQPRFARLCLSQRFIDKYKITPGAVDLFFEDVEKTIKEQIGDLDAVVMKDAELIAPRTVQATLTNGERAVQVVFVLESDYEVSYRSVRLDSDFGQTKDISEVMTIDDDGGHIHLPLPKDKASVDQVYQVQLNNYWKIDEVVDPKARAARPEAAAEGATPE